MSTADSPNEPLSTLAQHFPDYTWTLHMDGWRGVAPDSTLTVLPISAGYLAHSETPKRNAARTATSLLAAAQAALHAP